MGFSESDSKCRRHPNPRQIPGVCASCLREKLLKVSTSSSFNRKSTTFISYTSSATSSPPYSTASSSSAATATRKSPGSRHRRNGSEAYVSVGMVLNDGLKKSRSVSCAPLSSSKHRIDCVNSEKIIGGKIINNNKNNNNFVDGILEEGNLRKKNGFLKKLINSTSKKTKGVLSHSKTMKERSHNISIVNGITKNNKN